MPVPSGDFHSEASHRQEELSTLCSLLFHFSNLKLFLDDPSRLIPGRTTPPTPHRCASKHLPPSQHFLLSIGKGVSPFSPLLSKSSPPPLTTTSNLSPGDQRRLSLSSTYAPAAAAAPKKVNPGATRMGKRLLETRALQKRVKGDLCPQSRFGGLQLNPETIPHPHPLPRPARLAAPCHGPRCGRGAARSPGRTGCRGEPAGAVT